MTFQNNEKFHEIKNEVNLFHESMWIRFTPNKAVSDPDQTEFFGDSLKRVVSESSNTVGDAQPSSLNFMSHVYNRILSSVWKNDNEPDTVTTRRPDQAVLSPSFVKFDGSGVGNLDVDLSEINHRSVSIPEGGIRELLSLTSIINSPYAVDDENFILKISIAKTELDNDSAIISNVFYTQSYAKSKFPNQSTGEYAVVGLGYVSTHGPLKEKTPGVIAIVWRAPLPIAPKGDS